MAQTKLHFPVLAGGSTFGNLHVERLTADPSSLPNAGRVWYNTTDKLFKFTALDGSNAVVVRSFATAEALASEIQTLTDYVDNAIAQIGNAFNYVGTVTGGATSGAAFDLSTLTQKDAGDYYKVTTAGWFKQPASGTAFYANVGDGLVFNLASDVDLIDNTHGSVSGTTDEIVVTGSVDTGFTVSLAPAVLSRITTVETAVNDLEAAVGDVTQLTTTATDLVGAVNELASNSSGAVSNVVAAINSMKFTYSSTTAALTHTVTHNMGMGVLYQVLVKNDDGKFQNDIPYVLTTDDNTLTVELSEAANIYVAVLGMASISA